MSEGDLYTRLAQRFGERRERIKNLVFEVAYGCETKDGIEQKCIEHLTQLGLKDQGNVATG